MSRAKSSQTHRRHKKIIKMAKGYRGRRKNCYRTAIQAVEKGLQYAYRDRKVKKRNFRALWIQRINAAARELGLTYSQFMNGLNKAGMEIDRKMLAELAVREPKTFKAIFEQAKSALNNNKASKGKKSSSKAQQAA